MKRLILRLLHPDITAQKLDLYKGCKAAGDLFRIQLFQQRTVRDIGGDDGGQLCAQAVIQQTVQIRQEEAGIELGAQIIKDQQIGVAGSLEQSLFLTAGVCAEMQRFQLAEKVRAGDIDHIIVLPQHLPGNGKGGMGLAQPCVTHQQQAFAGGGEKSAA